MNQTNLLVVVLCKNNLGRTDWREKNIPTNINIIDIVYVNSAQIDLVNKAVSSAAVSDVLVTCETQDMNSGYFTKLLEILYSCERHGAVVSLNKYSRGICQLTKEQYEKASEYLSDYRVIPHIESFPVLMKKEMFERFGLLAESFGSIAGALADFSLRFNQYGWSTVRANCWNDGETCFELFLESDKDIIQKKYPYLQKIEEIYYEREERAADHFANLLAFEKRRKPDLLFSLYEVPAAYNGTANYTFKLLEAFWNNYHEKYEISILVKKSTDEFYKLSEKYPKVYYPGTIKHQTFCLGYIVSQVFSAEHMDIINRCCLKYSVCILDIICLRSHYLCKNDMGRFELFRDSIEYANLMLSISRFSHDDIIHFFHDELQHTPVRTGFVYLGTDKKVSGTESDETIEPFKAGNYFIVIGNPYKHKMLEPVMEILKDIEENFIVIGTKTEGYYQKSKRIYGYVSGWLDSASLDGMIAGAKCIIFPSVYEGFGLTLYDAAIYQKKIIVSDTQVNFELKQLLGEYENQVILYRRPEELKVILSQEKFCDIGEKKTVRIKNWQDVAEDLEAWLASMQKEEINIVQLERRWKYLKRYESKCEDSTTKNSEKRERFIKKCISHFPRTYQLYRRFVTAINKEHYGNC